MRHMFALPKGCVKPGVLVDMDPCLRRGDIVAVYLGDPKGGEDELQESVPFRVREVLTFVLPEGRSQVTVFCDFVRDDEEVSMRGEGAR